MYRCFQLLDFPRCRNLAAAAGAEEGGPQQCEEHLESRYAAATALSQHEGKYPFFQGREREKR